MAMINSQTDVPDAGDTVVSRELSDDGRVVWVTFASGKTLCAHVDDLTDAERANVSTEAAGCAGGSGSR